MSFGLALAEEAARNCSEVWLYCEWVLVSVVVRYGADLDWVVSCLAFFNVWRL
jgi:hypothetical protein